MIVVSVLSFFNPLAAESYSDFVFDDAKSHQNYGAVSKSKPKSIEAEGWNVDTQLFLSPSFRSQKGGEDSERANRYLSKNQIVAPTRIQNTQSNFNFGFLISPRAIYTEERITNREIQKIGDSEAFLYWTQNINTTKLKIDAGRAYNRLDRFGFLFVGMSNFGQIQITSQNRWEWNLIGLVFKNEEENLDERAFRQKTRNIAGTSLKSNDLFFWEEWRIFFYRYKEPVFNPNQNPFLPQRNFGEFMYSGFDFRSKRLNDFYFFDLSFINALGERKNSFTPFSETKFVTNSILAYGALHREESDLFLSLAGLYTKKDQRNRSDFNSNGFAGSGAEPRVLGGYSSFLLYQTISDSEPIFNDTKINKDPNFENKGIQIFGMQIGKRWNSKLRTDLFVNRSDSNLGKGTEVIAKAHITPFESQNSFFQFSIAYAQVNPMTSRTLLIEPFSEKIPVKEYVRIYLSSAIQF
ncbi:MAG: hypothetical protein O9301_03715 [Leptospira sp.]|nr:hypothetical protein [Leptospira sp.]